MAEIYKYGIILSSTICAAFGNYFFKLSTGNIKRPSDVFRSYQLYAGVLIYCASTLLYIISHRLLSISVIVAMSSLTYIWTMFIAKIKLKEKVGRMKVAGAVLIVLGTIVSVYAKYLSMR